MGGQTTGGRLEERATFDRIIAAAAELFYEHGYHATTTRQIAARVGVKAGSLYHHFAGKQEILFRIAFDTMRDMHELALRRLAAERTPEARLRAFVEAHVLYTINERHRARVADAELRALDPANRARVIEMRDAYEMLLRDILRDGQERAGWRLPDPVLAFGIATMATGVESWYRPDGRLTPEQVAALYADFTLAAVSP